MTQTKKTQMGSKLTAHLASHGVELEVIVIRVGMGGELVAAAICLGGVAHALIPETELGRRIHGEKVMQGWPPVLI